MLLKKCMECMKIINDYNTPICCICDEYCNDDKKPYCRDIKCSVKNNSSIVRDLTKYVQNAKGIIMFMCNICYDVFIGIEDENTKCFIINKAVERYIDNDNFCFEEDEKIEENQNFKCV